MQGRAYLCCCPCFETAAPRPPQHEVGVERATKPHPEEARSAVSKGGPKGGWTAKIQQGWRDLMTLPAATLDHVVINAREDMDRAADIYRRLGFTLTERGYHSLGSMNHLAMFGTDYLELIAVPPPSQRGGATTGRLDLLHFPFGLNGLVFGSEDSAVTYSELTKVGVPVEPPVEFTRPVKYSGGQGGPRSRTARMDNCVSPYCPLSFI